MKKVAIVSVIVACVLTSVCSYGFKNLTRENVHVHSTSFENDWLLDEYEHHEDAQLQEYEQHVCDQVVVQPPSAIMVMCTEIGGRILIRLIILKEAFRRYYRAFREMIKKLFQARVA